MKRLFALLLALCLPMTAFADTIAERIGAPETWEGEFATNTGKSRIHVNMTVQVPDVEAIPIWAVEPHTFTVEEIALAADIFLGEGTWQQRAYSEEARDDVPVEDGPRYLVEHSDWIGYGITDYDCTIWNTETDNDLVWTSYSIMDDMNSWHPGNEMLVDLSGYGTDRDIGPLEEAIRKADAIVAQLAPGMVYESVDPARRGRDGLSSRYDDQYGYRLYYAREVNGIRITPEAQYGARYAHETMNPVLRYEHLYLDVDKNGVFELRWSDPIEVTERVAEDCELLSFEQIMDIFATIAPLSIQHMEGEGNNTLSINRAVLGYMCLQERGKPTSYRLVPVWDFYGVRTFAREHYDFHNWSWLTINAIDGTIIDRELGY